MGDEGDGVGGEGDGVGGEGVRGMGVRGVEGEGDGISGIYCSKWGR